ncbi:MAG: cupin domain-containing protein [Anaerolineaceae bacterium]
MSVKHIHEIESTPVKDGVGVSRKVLISAQEGPNMAMRCFTIQPGGRLVKHCNLVEHEQYIIAGKAELGIGDEVVHVQKGDIVFIPALAPHYYTNTGNEPFEFLCMVPNIEDAMTILE